MQYTEILYLISRTDTEDAIGNVIASSSTLNKCYAKKQSVRTYEFYGASQLGLTPECEFVIKRLNYNGEKELRYNDEIYSVIRTIDPKNKFDIVLVCERKVGNDSTPGSD